MNRPPFLVSTKPPIRNSTLTGDLRDRNHGYKSRGLEHSEKGLSDSTRGSLVTASEDGKVSTDGGKNFTDWKPGRQEWMVIWTLSLISVVVALDSTILVTALPVSGFSLAASYAAMCPGRMYEAKRRGLRNIG
jgi:hypothetical protein